MIGGAAPPARGGDGAFGLIEDPSGVPSARDADAPRAPGDHGRGTRGRAAVAWEGLVLERVALLELSPAERSESGAVRRQRH